MVERGVEPVSLPELWRAPTSSRCIRRRPRAPADGPRRAFRQMKNTAIYISTGRGPTTDEEALIKALDEGMIAAAGLDVSRRSRPAATTRS